MIKFIVLVLLLVINSSPLNAAQDFDCSTDCQRSISELKKFASNGSPHAQTLLGLVYKSGELNNPKDNSKAWKWMNRANNQSFPPAMLYLSRWYRAGFNTAKDTEKADYYLERAATFGYSPALYEQGVRLLNTQDYELGMRYLTTAADNGYKKADRLIEKLRAVPADKKATAMNNSAMEAALTHEPGDRIITVVGNQIQPHELFTVVLSTIQELKVYNRKGTTGSRLSTAKCGQPGTACRQIDINNSAISGDLWLY